MCRYQIEVIVYTLCRLPYYVVYLLKKVKIKGRKLPLMTTAFIYKK